ncbi:lactoferrin/transferrin family TonB-dependent receptor [Taylorella equigenitalis]|uniref:Transferrin binding protein n=1 Tax=Taylorella equigenitalis ATCC 35865 TaxID=743973 RepID=A0ABM5NB06_9BURK|nr:lactoferrin/transferrin family TonB-dependent receptor [Taylorella equigenitalis]AFN36120.1 transferrin binding protein [Taylorella equigenitalis ATCC 35865]ASY39532.1 lactoferrin/transferrin family TonB-dependent receptor [Taylorella equigenitalis]VEG31794.1 Transferrin-binding protein 1 precursor [Taylorella equigenitalis ATCC 35865]
MSRYLNPIAISLVASIFFSQTAFGQNKDNSANLETIEVVGTKTVTKKDNEVTGLGKVVKSYESLSKEQVLGIRDLARYDPGISIVEQGRGASSGFSIRGVDKNRVAVIVDGIPQIQSYNNKANMHTYNAQIHGSGSINEIEFENVSAVTVSKGASSAEFGSGSLGGAVSFKTKDASDVIKPGKNWGLQTKSSYGSKNKQLLNSVALAGKFKGFEGLAIFTNRRGKETEPHKAIYDMEHNFTRIRSYTDLYDFSSPIPNTESKYGWLKVDGSDDVFHAYKLSLNKPPFTLPNRDMTPEEIAQYYNSWDEKLRVKSGEYTGPGRVVPDPMEYKTNSLLLKLGFNINSQNYVGAIYEKTKQNYDTRDMTYRSYWSNHDGIKYGSAVNVTKGIPVPGLGPLSALAYGDSEGATSFNWAKSRFFDEHHEKKRLGFEYKFYNPEAFINNVNFSYNTQDIELDTLRHDHNCSQYPNIDKNCRPNSSKPFSSYFSERNVYKEKHNIFLLDLAKQFEIAKTKHDARITTGFDKSESVLEIKDLYREYFMVDWKYADEKKSYQGTKEDPIIYKMTNPRFISDHFCRYDGSFGENDCRPRRIEGRNIFIGLRDSIKFNKYLDLSFGARWDYHNYKSSDSFVSAGKFKNFTWDTGIEIRPLDWLAFTYRLSRGFKVPTFQEMFGYRVTGLDASSTRYNTAHKLNSEKSFNQEVGLALSSKAGYLEFTYFKDKYRDLISIAKSPKERTYGFYNVQNFNLHGFNVNGWIDLNGLYSKIPEGAYATIAYSYIKADKVFNNPGFIHVGLAALDALQPSRVVFGLGYDHPAGIWGFNVTSTFSNQKNLNELLSQEVAYEGKIIYKTAAQKTTKSWYTVDLSAYYKIKDLVTFRAGVYNLFDYKYLTWEAVRQSADGAINRHTNVNYARYAAPGRNFTLSLEVKY